MAKRSLRTALEAGEFIAAPGLHDMTEWRRMENSLHQNEKLAALGSLLAGVAHELNNPLAVVLAQSTLMKEKAADPATVSRAEKICNAAMRCARILLEEAGSRLADVVKITIYITDRAYREPVYQVVGRWLKGVYPVSTGIVVSALARPEWLVEIDAIAVIPDDAA